MMKIRGLHYVKNYLFYFFTIFSVGKAKGKIAKVCVAEEKAVFIVNAARGTIYTFPLFELNLSYILNL